ncbi:MAG: ISNCY family transposase [Bdellovibrionales bacterium]|nr:ISNCY family transposase [Bdellovibrionales bacterium]
MEGMVLLEKKQVKVYRLALKVLEGQMTIRDFSILTGKSYRQAQRIIQKIRCDDIEGMIHGNSKKIPPNKTTLEKELEIIKLLKTKYHGFNLIHFKEMIEANEGIIVSKTVLYRMAKKHSLQAIKYRRSKKLHKPRARHAQEGMLVQFDGSEHPWFNDQFTDLIAAIDDATGKILAAEFFKGETSNNSMKVIRDVINTHGIPEAFYTDQAGSYGKKDRDWTSQIARALSSINCRLIIAGSPQAKGRVERLFKTLQGRLVSELKLFNIKTMIEANKFLKEDFVPRFNERFGVLAREEEKAYLPYVFEDLDLVFCKKFYRKIGKNNTFSWEGKLWIIDGNSRYDNRIVNVNAHLDGSMSFDIMGKIVTAKKTEKDYRFFKKAG